MPTATMDIRNIQRQGLITNLAGRTVASWRWIQGRLLLDNIVEQETDFVALLDDIKANGALEFEPSESPSGYGVKVRRTPFQELAPAQLDMALKRKGFFMHELAQPVR